MPSGLQFRNIVLWNHILLVGFDHGFQLTVADGRFLIFPDILAVFTLTGQIWLGKGCVTIGRNLCPQAFAVLVLMDCLCGKYEACPGGMIAAVRIGDHDLQHLAAILRCEGFHRSFAKMQGDLFDLFIVSVLLAHLLFLLIIEVFRFIFFRFLRDIVSVIILTIIRIRIRAFCRFSLALFVLQIEERSARTACTDQKNQPDCIRQLGRFLLLFLRNEKYIGDALLQKTYTTDFLTKKRIKNNGTVPQYYVEGDHEAIIPKDIFLLVQEELARRRAVHLSNNGKRRAYSCKHCFAQMVFCGDCGEFFRRVHWNNRGCKSVVWRYVSRLENTGHVCRARTINEEYLQEVVIQAINQVLCKKDDFLKALQTNIATVIKQGDTLSPEVIDERLRELQKELLKKANQKDDYDAIADEILRLRDMRKQAEVDSVVRDEQMRLIRDLQDFIRQQPTTITEFDETLVKRLITKITVFEDHFAIDFKSGVTIEIKA